MTPNQLSLTTCLEKLHTREFSVSELVQSCLDHIAAVEPKLHAFVTLNPQVIDQAKKIDAQISQDHDIFKTQPLLGIPIAIKDNCLTLGLRTTASAKVLDKFIPPFDATVVAKLKTVGALIIGKTNMDAWAHGSSTETSDYGPTHNPWNLNHLPGGSSGGSAAAVAADLCTFAIGTETAGSIRQPAAWCGVTGFKPTYGRVSRYGIVAMASSTDSPGLITKSVQDAALILPQIAGHDSYDATTIKSALDLTNVTASIKGMRLGLPTDYLVKEMSPEVIKIIMTAVEVFKSLGATVGNMELLDPKYSVAVYTILQRSEVSSNLARFDGIRYGHDRTFFGAEAKKRMLLGTYSLSAGYYDAFYKKALQVRTLIVNDFNQAFKKFDAIIGPVSPGPALKIGASLDQPMFGEIEDQLVEASSIAGLTGLSVPCGFVAGLPIGLQITGPQQAESIVTNLGLAYQQATDWHHRKPKI